MRLSQMRTWTRRRLHDEGTDQRFDNDAIDSALNVGAQQVQTYIEDINPGAFEREYRTNLLINTTAYQLPRGFLRHKTLLIDWSGTGNYLEVTPTSIGRIRTPRLAQYLSDTYYYAISGGVLRLKDTPSADVEDGFQLWYVPSLEMSDEDDDLEASGLFAPFHMAVILWAVKLLSPEEGEPTAELDAEIGKIMGRAKTVYGGDFNGPEELLVEGIGKEYSR
jgi:hypothetical protein